jgi:hypothetical protein
MWNEGLIKLILPFDCVVCQTLGKTRGLEPKVVHWLYTGVIMRMLMKTATVWWLKVSMVTVKTELGCLQQRLDCVTGSVRMAPTAAFEVLLGPPLFTWRLWLWPWLTC